MKKIYSKLLLFSGLLTIVCPMADACVRPGIAIVLCKKNKKLCETEGGCQVSDCDVCPDATANFGNDKIADDTKIAKKDDPKNPLFESSDQYGDAVRKKDAERLQAIREQELANKIANDRLAAAEREADRVAARGANIPPDNQFELYNDRKQTIKAKDAVQAGKMFPEDEANAVKNPTIRRNLILLSNATKIRKELKEEEARNGLELSKLAEMAAVTMQAATAMNSLNQDTAATLGNSKSINSSQPGLSTSSGRDPASIGEEGSKVSVKSGEQSLDGAAAVSKAEEAKQKISDAIADAEKRKKAFMLKKGLRKQLQDKLAKNGAAATREGVDPEELFSGKLNQEPVSERAEAEVPAQVEQSPVVQAFHAMSSNFNLAGHETDEEVNRIVAETEQELGSAEQELGATDQKSGILDSESLSLFARVKRVHDQCVRQKCVAR